MISEQDIRQACWKEHRAILACCAEWDHHGTCSPELWETLQHHQVVLSALRDLLTLQYHTILHR